MSDKIKTILSIIGVVVSTAFLIVVSYLTEYDMVSSLLATVLTLVSILVLLTAICFAVKIDYETGEYVCEKCGHIFKPRFGEYLFGAHTLTTRHLRCHKCNKKSWCKRKTVIKDNG